MNKSELINALAEKTSFSKKDAEKALNAFVETINGALAKGEKVQLIGFGTFDVKKRPARTARNPRTLQPAYGIYNQCHPPLLSERLPDLEGISSGHGHLRSGHSEFRGAFRADGQPPAGGRHEDSH